MLGKVPEYTRHIVRQRNYCKGNEKLEHNYVGYEKMSQERVTVNSKTYWDAINLFPR